MERERLGSRLGFILLSAGCAIGIGNVWKFPYMAGQYGGGAFVLIYIFFLLIFSRFSLGDRAVPDLAGSGLSRQDHSGVPHPSSGRDETAVCGGPSPGRRLPRRESLRA